MSLSVLILTLVDVDYWAYHGEGGTNLLLRYVGPLPSLFGGRVLRLCKSKYATSSRLVTPAEQEEAEEREIVAQSYIISLLGEEWRVPGQRIKLERAFLDGVEKRLREAGQRPLERSALGTIDCDRRWGTLMEDLSAQDDAASMTVEIKVSSD